jgi:RNA polymerase sigma factor (sigma-70 family)
MPTSPDRLRGALAGPGRPLAVSLADGAILLVDRADGLPLGVVIPWGDYLASLPAPYLELPLEPPAGGGAGRRPRRDTLPRPQAPEDGPSTQDPGPTAPAADRNGHHGVAPDEGDRAPPATADPDPRAALLAYEPLVMKLAIQYGADRGNVRDSEQYADGWIGLTKAAQRFDPAGEATFATYAFKFVRGRIINGLRARRFGSRNGPAIPVRRFSEMGHDEEGGDFAATVADRFAEAGVVDVRDACERYMRGLHARTRRLVVRVVMNGWTMERAGAAEEKPIGAERVRRIVDKALAKMKRAADRDLSACGIGP